MRITKNKVFLHLCFIITILSCNRYTLQCKITSELKTKYVEKKIMHFDSLLSLQSDTLLLLNMWYRKESDGSIRPIEEGHKCIDVFSREKRILNCSHTTIQTIDSLRASTENKINNELLYTCGSDRFKLLYSISSFFLTDNFIIDTTERVFLLVYQDSIPVYDYRFSLQTVHRDSLPDKFVCDYDSGILGIEEKYSEAYIFGYTELPDSWKGLNCRFNGFIPIELYNYYFKDVYLKSKKYDSIVQLLMNYYKRWAIEFKKTGLAKLREMNYPPIPQDFSWRQVN